MGEKELERVKKELSSGSALLLDVRTQEEWDVHHLPGAFHWPLQRLEEGELPSHLPVGQTIYVYCMRGFRAQRAIPYLEELSSDVQPLTCTFGDLCQAGVQGTPCGKEG